jgi:hypothetical protein
MKTRVNLKLEEAVSIILGKSPEVRTQYEVQAVSDWFVLPIALERLQDLHIYTNARSLQVHSATADLFQQTE